MSIEKGSPEWTMWADLFTLYRETGEWKSDKDIQRHMDSARALTEKYKGTGCEDMALRLCLAMLDVLEERYKKEKEIQNARF